MKKQGTIIRWDAARGFGFIRSPGSTDVFLHVRDFRDAGSLPREGLQVVFEEIHVGGKGPRAMAVHALGSRAAARPARQRARPARTSASVSRPAPHAGAALLLMGAYAAMLVWGAWNRHLAVPLVLASPLLSAVTFVMYWHDKHAAQRGAWRTSESTLHALSLAGGWPGAWFAQQLLRHKSSKAEFRGVYWVTVTLHCAALLAWLWHTAQRG